MANQFREDWVKFETVLNEEKIAELGLKLMNREVMNDQSLMELTGDVVDFVKTLIKRNNKKDVKKFLLEHKHHFTSTMRDLISEEIKAMNPGKL